LSFIETITVALKIIRPVRCCVLLRPYEPSTHPPLPPHTHTHTHTHTLRQTRYAVGAVAAISNLSMHRHLPSRHTLEAVASECTLFSLAPSQSHLADEVSCVKRVAADLLDSADVDGHCTASAAHTDIIDNSVSAAAASASTAAPSPAAGDVYANACAASIAPHTPFLPPKVSWGPVSLIVCTLPPRVLAAEQGAVTSSKNPSCHSKTAHMVLDLANFDEVRKPQRSTAVRSASHAPTDVAPSSLHVLPAAQSHPQREEQQHVPSPPHAAAAAAPQPPPPLLCPVCSIDTGSMTEKQRGAHVNLCADMAEKREGRLTRRSSR
jgi:hypothetical protein